MYIIYTNKYFKRNYMGTKCLSYNFRNLSWPENFLSIPTPMNIKYINMFFSYREIRFEEDFNFFTFMKHVSHLFDLCRLSCIFMYPQKVIVHLQNSLLSP